MAYKILIRTIESADAGGDVLVEYEARNLQSFSYDITIPAQSMALPEDFKEEAILVKAEGNTGKMVFTWVIKDEDTIPFNTLTSWKNMWYQKPEVTGGGNTDDIPHTLSVPSDRSLYYSRKLKALAVGGEEITTTGNPPHNSAYTGRDTKTADTQMIALSELFEKRGIGTEERHEVILRNSTSNYNIFKQDGIITRLSFNKSATDPVTWNATVELTIGNVISSTQES